MDWTTLLSLAGMGFAAGTIGAMLGIGGGVFVVPFLSLVLHLPMHVAIGTSLVAVVANSSATSTAYVKKRLTNIRLGVLLESTMVAGAIVGALVAVVVQANILSALFGAALVYAACSMGMREAERGAGETLVGGIDVFKSPLAAGYYDHYLQKAISYSPARIPLGLVVNFFAGNLAGLLGIGGGIVQVPLLNLLLGVPMKAAVATSSFSLGVTGASSCLVYFSQGYLYPLIIAPVVIGVFLGTQLGTQLAQRVKGLILRRIFAGVLFLVAIPMVLKAFNIALP